MWRRHWPAIGSRCGPSGPTIGAPLVKEPERCCFAVEIRDSDLKGLKLFGADYPEARRWLVYGGDQRELRDGVELLPIVKAFDELLQAL